ncbi:MAG: hypothetical protein PHY93_11040 [Bacteriovorax sp.]|nr:hypothetical protein [Bacteriovorax sp.]
MKYFPLFLIFSLSSASLLANEDEGYLSAGKYAGSYSGTIISDNAGAASGAIQDVAHSIAVPTREASSSAWGYIVDVKDGAVKRAAIANGDGVSINASVYALSLRQAERDNTPLKTLEKDKEKRQYEMAKSREEADRLQKLAKEYSEVATNFQLNMSASIEGIADSSKKLAGWDKEKQVKLDKLLADHKKLGTLTAEDGSARMGEHTLISMKETLTDLETFIKKSPDAAAKAGLTKRFSAMSSLMEGAQARLSEKENQMRVATAKINELSRTDENQVAETEANMQRKMILGTLNNSVTNLINSGDFSKVRSQLAFTHFKEVEKEMAEKGVKSGDVKKAYMAQTKELAEQYNNTPFGIYVNSQIAKAMGSVCDLVKNQCKEEGSNGALFNFLDDSSRGTFKVKSPAQVVEPVADKNTIGK